MIDATLIVWLLRFCLLNTPKDNNEARKIAWIQCTRCDTWVHCLCVGMQVEDVETSAFVCV